MADGFRMIVPLPDLAATAGLGARIAALLQSGDLVALSGDLGAGKTTLARAILTGLGVAEHVPSPSFTLAQAYDTARLAVLHVDLYRLKNPSELAELGLEEALENGAVLVEWPERADLPASLRIDLDGEGANRHATLQGSARWRAME